MVLITALVLLYLVLGLWVWTLGTDALGGKDQYLMLLAKDYKHPCILYYTALVAVVIFWPIFMIRGIWNK